MALNVANASSPWLRRLLRGLLLLVLLLFALSLLNPLRIVSAGQRGVVLTFGKVDPVPLPEGIHVVWPFVQRLVLIDVRVQKNEGKGLAASADLQTVNATAALNWRIDAARAAEIFQRIGMPEVVAARIIEPAAQESVKAITARFTAEQLITKRLEVTAQIRDTLEARLKPYGVVVESLAAVNYDFSQAFDQAIEAKVTAEQTKLKAERDLERIKVEAEQKIAQAKAEAEALRVQRQEITPELLKLRQIENEKAAIAKWDGKLPQYTGGPLPFIGVGKTAP
ncbi:MAG: prohibitin family protein [Burkholderiaceae bacterium]|nr:prohibitin family protein [Burkholderiaceae bacterium]